MKKFFFIPFLSLLLMAPLAGCSEDPFKPDDLLDEPIYKDIAGELFLAGALAELKGGDVSVDSLRQRVFDHFDVDKERFERSHEYYQRNPEKQMDRFEQIRERIRDEQEGIQDSRIEHLNRHRNGDEEEPPAADPADRAAPD